MLSETCTRCGAEVRHGTRTARRAGKDLPLTGWWHREDVDHNATFGTFDREAFDHAMQLWHENHQTEHEEAHAPVPDPEIRALRLDPDIKRLFLATPDGLQEVVFPGGAKTLVNAARKTGWDMQAEYARGPWMHATHWRPTGIVDHVVLRLRRGEQCAVATWRDGKAESSWWWLASAPGSLEQINSKDLRERIKEPCTSTAPDPGSTATPAERVA